MITDGQDLDVAILAGGFVEVLEVISVNRGHAVVLGSRTDLAVAFEHRALRAHHFFCGTLHEDNLLGELWRNTRDDGHYDFDRLSLAIVPGDDGETKPPVGMVAEATSAASALVLMAVEMAARPVSFSIDCFFISK